MKRGKRIYFRKRRTLIFALLFATLIFVCFGCASGTTPTAFFTYPPRYPGVNHPITFDASICYDSEGCITNYEWDFGDGNRTNTTEKIITHSYALEGDYSVNLTVTDNDGAKKSTSKEVTVLMSPSPEEEWSKTFGGPTDDMANSVQQTADGGYILAGVTWSGGTAPTDVWLMKTDSNGKVLWNKTFGGTARDKARSVQQTIDGGYILAGETYSYGAGQSDFWLVKTNSNGSEQWNKTFGGTAFDRAYSVQQTTDGGYILAGGSGSIVPGGGTGSAELFGNDCDVWRVKTDSNGNEEWIKTFSGTSGDYAHCVQQTADGGYILAGGRRSYASDDYDVWLIKVKGEPAEPTGELTEQPVPIPGFKISGLLLGLILSVALATLKKMKNR